MKRSFALTLISGLFVAAATAQDAVTIKLRERGEGEAALIIKTETGTFNLKIVDGKGKVLPDQTDRSSDVKEYTETIIQRVGTKLPTKLERHYTKAHTSKGGMSFDWPVVGKTLVIEKVADKYTFAYKGGGAVAGPAGDALAKEFSRKGDTDNEFEKLMLPKAAVKPGESWKLDMEPIVKDLAKGGELDVSAAGARGVGTLQKTYTQDGRLFGVMAYKLEVPVRALGKGGQQIKFNDGARITIEASMDLCIDGMLESGTTRSRIVITGDAALAKVPGAVATLNIVNELVQTHRPVIKK